jgi:hypothetical protein
MTDHDASEAYEELAALCAERNGNEEAGDGPAAIAIRLHALEALALLAFPEVPFTDEINEAVRLTLKERAAKGTDREST